MYQSCEKLKIIAQGQRGKDYSAYNTNKEGNWIGKILSVNSALKNIIQEKIEGRIDMTGGRGRERLLEEFKDTIIHWKLKVEAVDLFC